jgi:hypothetical protein
MSQYALNLFRKQPFREVNSHPVVDSGRPGSPRNDSTASRPTKVARFDRGNGFILDMESLEAGDPVQMSMDDLYDAQ